MDAPAQSKASSALEWLLAAILSANIVWTTLQLGGARPETMVVSSAINALLLLACLLGAAAGLVPRARGEGWWFVPFLAYAAVNVLWITPVPWLGWADWLLWAQMFAVFWVCLNGIRRPSARGAVLCVLLVLGVAAVLLGVYQRVFDPDWLMMGRTQSGPFIGRSSGPFAIPNSLAALLILLLPTVLVIAAGKRHGLPVRFAAAVAAAAFSTGLVLTISRGAWLSFAVACAAWPLLVPGRSWRWRAGGAFAALAALAVLGATVYAGSARVRERITYLMRDRGEVTRPILWRASVEMFKSAPLVGTGAGSYNIVFEKHRPERFADEPLWTHNEYLNTLSDHGAAGFVLVFGAAGMLAVSWLSRMRRLGPPEPGAAWMQAPEIQVALAVGMFAFAMQLFVDFHFKIPALGMIASCIAGFLVSERRSAGSAPPARPWRRIAAAACAAGTVIVFFSLARPHYGAEAARFSPRKEIDKLALGPPDAERQREVVIAAHASFMRATELNPANAQAWSDLSYAIALRSNFESSQSRQLGIDSEAAANRAIRIAPMVYEFWIRQGVAREVQGRWIDAGASFTKALELAPHASNAWYHMAYHQSLNQTTRALARSAVAISLRLDPENAVAEALRQQLAKQP